MQLSYAQNLEDLHLDLVLGDTVSGVYVDVGGGHPVADNVSFWFYLKGWCGLVVEPQAGLAAAYAGIRPRDRVAVCIAGAAEGTAEFHIVDKLHGLSSTLAASAESARQYGAGYRTETLPVRRLDALCREAGIEAIDFLKIDVEGAEAAVLAGIDLERLRPRIIVVEAVHPGNMVDAWKSFEPALLAARYHLAFQDNLNRFYVAAEHAALQARFPASPWAWDSVGHLWDHGRAAGNPAHADHVLATALVHGLMASLPTLGSATLLAILARGLSAMGQPLSGAAAAALLAGKAEYPGDASPLSDLESFLVSDRGRAALGRIACAYDGGHIMG